MLNYQMVYYDIGTMYTHFSHDHVRHFSHIIRFTPYIWWSSGGFNYFITKQGGTANPLPSWSNNSSVG